MKYNPDIHHRRSIRLKNYDYSQAGMYFVTICVNHRLPLFGQIVTGKMVLNDAGKMIEKWWFELLTKFWGRIDLHEFVVMPNHFHGIIEIVGAIPCGRPQSTQFPNIHETKTVHHETTCVGGRPQGIAPTIGQIIGAFKSLTTNEYIRNVRQNHWQSFEQKLWQRNYHEHIIRNEADYLRIANYVEINPLRWREDCYFLTVATTGGV
jgi:REP element-mobilizing transposase RayT